MSYDFTFRVDYYYILNVKLITVNQREVCYELKPRKEHYDPYNLQLLDDHVVFVDGERRLLCGFNIHSNLLQIQLYPAFCVEEY